MSYRSYLPKEIRLCRECGKEFVATIGGYADRRGRPQVFCSRRCSAKIGIETHLARIKSAGTWKGGSAYVKKALDYYPNECVTCGATERLHVHHKDEDRTNDALENLMILCKSCHHRHHNTKTQPYCRYGHDRVPGKRCKLCVRGWNQNQAAKRRATSISQ